MDCYIDARPAFALVTKKSVSGDDLKKMQDLLMSYSLSDLEKTGMVSSDIEKLEPYDKTLKEYVGDYGNYINALNPSPHSITPSPSLASFPSSTSTYSNPSSTSPPGGAASSIAVSFTLQIIAVVALALLT